MATNAAIAALYVVLTLIACTCVMFCKRLGIAIIFPVISNSFIVGFELWKFLGEPFWLSVGLVAIGEAPVMIVGYIFFMIIKRRPRFYRIINANQKIGFKW